MWAGKVARWGGKVAMWAGKLTVWAGYAPGSQPRRRARKCGRSALDGRARAPTHARPPDAARAPSSPPGSTRRRPMAWTGPHAGVRHLLRARWWAAALAGRAMVCTRQARLPHRQSLALTTLALAALALALAAAAAAPVAIGTRTPRRSRRCANPRSGCWRRCRALVRRAWLPSCRARRCTRSALGDRHACQPRPGSRSHARPTAPSTAPPQPRPTTPSRTRRRPRRRPGSRRQPTARPTRPATRPTRCARCP